MANLVLFAMMVLTFVDVWARYGFNAPIPGGFEITEYLLVILIYAALPLVTARDEHVTVDVLDSLIPEAITRIQRHFMNLLAGLVLCFLTWRLWVKAGQSIEDNMITTDLEMPLAPLIYFMSILAGITALAFLIKAVIPEALTDAGELDDKNG
jgi:TRAP-type C4-dicarboxylate transport system permease small subunit|tara:strand:+ start:1821 stop:2279 length:459 start_codon:yes stop_codon:yes gene_type:complete